MTKSWFRREMLAPRRLAFNIIFYGLQIFFFGYGWYSQETHKKLAALNSLKWSVWTSRGAGLVLAFDGGLILIPMLRNVIRVVRPRLTRLFPIDENVWFHRQVAYSLAFWAVVHTTAHYINFLNVELTHLRPEVALDIHYTQAGGISGHFLLLVMVLMYTTAHHTIRHQCFEAFWYTHHLAFFFMIGLYVHATGCFVRDSPRPGLKHAFPFYSTRHCLGYESWRFIIWPGVIYFGERMWREVRARRATRLSQVLVHPGDVIELRIVKPSFKYVAGQWLFLQVPDVSGLQWHPFTITSAPEDPYVSVHIRQVGDWTCALSKHVGVSPSAAASKTSVSKGQERGENLCSLRGHFIEFTTSCALRPLPEVRIDGPYGAPAEDVFRAEIAVLVGMGIGITPFVSILKHMWYCQRRGNVGSLKRVEFFWVCREVSSFGWFQSMLQEIEDSQSDPGFLRINIYLTQEVSEDMLWNIVLNDVGAERDPITLLRSRTTYGRPNWKVVYCRMRQDIESGQSPFGAVPHLKTRVNTFFCGPAPVAKAVKEACDLETCDSIKFLFTKEHF